MNKKSCYLYGARVVIEALRADKSLEKIFISRTNQRSLIRELAREANLRKTPYSKVPDVFFKKFAQSNHQGVIAISSPIEYENIERLIPDIYERGQIPLILILDGITDIRNFGAIARTAHCMGVHAILYSTKNNAQVNEDAIKTSAGALNHISLCRESDLAHSIDFLKNSGLKIVMLSEKEKKNISTLDLTTPLVLVMGSEEYGISMEIKKQADEGGNIPLYGNIASLNVSVATGMILYETQLQRSKIRN